MSKQAKNKKVKKAPTPSKNKTASKTKANSKKAAPKAANKGKASGKKSSKTSAVKAKKAQPKKAVRPAPKKKVAPVKTKAKPAAKAKKPVKKVVSKAKPKKLQKPVAKKQVKAATKKITSKAVKPAKKLTAKAKPVKKVQKPVKKAVKPVAKAKVAAKPIKKAPSKALPAKKEKAAPAKKVVVKAPKVEKKAVEKVKPLVEKAPKPKGKGGRKPKNSGGDDEPEIIHDELIEHLIQSVKKPKNQSKQPKIIKTFVNPIASLTVAPSESNKKAPKKEPKGKFEVEYVVRTSAGILYELLTTPSGLSEWFADDVNIRDGIFTFFWDGSEQKARLVGFKEEKFIRFSWLDKPDGFYFEFRIDKDELTGDVSLIVSDFADEAADMQTSKLLWDSQVNKLLHVLGSN